MPVIKSSDVHKLLSNGGTLRAAKIPKLKRTGSESQLVSACLKYLEMRGVYAWRSNNMAVYDPRRKCYRSFGGRKGVADVLGILAEPPGASGRLLTIECKTGTKQSEDQIEFQRQIESRGGVYLLVRQIDDLIDYFR